MVQRNTPPAEEDRHLPSFSLLPSNRPSSKSPLGKDLLPWVSRPPENVPNSTRPSRNVRLPDSSNPSRISPLSATTFLIKQADVVHRQAPPTIAPSSMRYIHLIHPAVVPATRHSAKRESDGRTTPRTRLRRGRMSLKTNLPGNGARTSGTDASVKIQSYSQRKISKRSTSKDRTIP